MTKALIHYFSGTGNSELTAKELGKQLEKYDYEIVIHSIEKGQLDYGEYQRCCLHIFVFPIYATALPHIMLKYIKGLPPGKDVNTAVVSTNGRINTRFRDGYQGWALHQARWALYLKKYKVFFSETLDFPHNITIVIPPRKETVNEQIIKMASEKFSDIALKIHRGEKTHRGIFFINFLWSIPFGILYTYFGRHFIGKLFVSDSSCNLCMLCVKKCPVDAIEPIKGRMKWRWNCEGCLRCMNSCPQNAIQVSVARIIAIIGAAVSIDSIFMKHFEFILPFNFIMGIVLFFVVFAVLDWILFQLSTLPLFRQIIQWGYTKYFKQYHAQKYEKIFKT